MENNLFKKFCFKSSKEWIQQIEKESGKEIQELESKYEEIKISPFYHNDLKQKTHNVNFPNDWLIYQLINVKDPKEANKRALAAIKNHANGICFSN